MVRSQDCKHFYYDRDGYPVCRKTWLFCTPTNDEKCPHFEPKDEKKDGE